MMLTVISVYTVWQALNRKEPKVDNIVFDG
jgi:hypothetical protein